jgi:hypothetical protein
MITAGSARPVRTLPAMALAAAAALSLAACDREGAGLDDRRWAPVYVSPLISVAVAAGHVERTADSAYLVSFRALHVEPRYKGSQRFDTEIIRTLLRCDPTPVTFKTVGVTLFDLHRPVYRRTYGLTDVAARPWRRLIPRSPDDTSLTRACARVRKLARGT